MKQKLNELIYKSLLSLIMGIFFISGVMLVSYAGSLNPTANNGLSNGSPIASMLSLLDMAQTTSGTFDRTTDSLEAISNKIDLVDPTPEAWHEVGAGGEPAFENSWVNYGAPHNTTAFYKDNTGRVYLRGLLKSGICGNRIFILPVGYRPTGLEQLQSMAATGNLAAVLQINTAGQVFPTVSGCNNTWYSLNNISFRTN